MNTKIKKITLPLSLVCLLGMVISCGLTAQRVHPEFENRVTNIRDAILVPPDVDIYELSSTGPVMLRNDWSEAGRANLQQAILHSCSNKRFSVKPLVGNSAIAEELAQIRALYKLVNKTMQRHTFGPGQATDKYHGFKYTLGSLEDILKELDADCLIFISGSEHVSSGGRKALIDLAIADPSGTIVYYSVRGSKEGNDLRDPNSAAVMVQDLLSSLIKTGV
ncbi:MAG: hypothetical protein PVG08_19520 [Desulfobacterales bacterium]|jgi:hypothetical protein